MVSEHAHFIDLIVTIVCAVLASSGFWTWWNNRSARSIQKDELDAAQSEMLVGLAHDRIVTKGLKYIDRGYITQEEFENLNVYLFKPYEHLGGNGSAARIMAEVRKLPLKSSKL